MCAHVSLFAVLRGMRCFPYCNDGTLDRNGFNGEIYFVLGLGECHPPRRGHSGGAARTWGTLWNQDTLETFCQPGHTS